MALMIRLRQQGRKNQLGYRIVVTDGRRKRDGEYVEAVGTYNPQDDHEDRHLTLDTERVRHWIDMGASVTEKAEALIKRKAPELLQSRTEAAVARRERARLKRKARKKAA